MNGCFNIQSNSYVIVRGFNEKGLYKIKLELKICHTQLYTCITHNLSHFVLYMPEKDPQYTDQLWIQKCVTIHRE